MILIADSGSTKTDWRLISNDGQIVSTQTIGLNPHVITLNDFETVINESLLKEWMNHEIKQVHFYGAGVTGKYLQEKLTKWLKNPFKDAMINIESDLLAAARAALGSNSGLIGILGTGSNSGYYDGESIVENIPPLGFILGDEGSGNALGKGLISLFLRSGLTADITAELKIFYPEHNNLLSEINSQHHTSRLLASFVPFIHYHLSDEAINKMVRQEFQKYFKILSVYSSSTDVALIGSVAYYFSEILNEIALDKGINLTTILKSPIDALTLYHQPDK
jgi:N-acetylglucosamine kinase-like BadF-type ATPase